MNYNYEKESLSTELEKINQNKFISKDEKINRKKPVEQRLLELSRLRKETEKDIKIADSGILLHFIPGYQTDLHKNPGSEKEWTEKNLDKNLNKLFADLEKHGEKISQI